MRIFLCMPTYDKKIYSEIAENLFDLVLEVKRRGDDLSINFPSSPFLSLSRNLGIKAALDTDADWVLMWDSDIQVGRGAFVYDMIDTAYKNEAAMVGLLVRLKLPQMEYACGMKDEGGYTRLTEAPTSPVEVDVMGAGVSLIKCSWLRDNLDQPFYEFQDGKGANGPTITPEDWTLCEKIKAKGGKIMVDPRFETIHWGISNYQYERK